LRPSTPLPLITLNRAAREPLHGQLREVLRCAIARGDLPPGGALPSSRALARRLGISRNTVLTAYQDLAAEGLLAGRIGSATRVQSRDCKGPVQPFDLSAILRAAHFPEQPRPFTDADGNRFYLTADR
jgi:GntR family transcriptional regulator/MocR family aminotransferase